MITVVYDKDRLYKGKVDSRLESYSQYVQIYTDIMAALHESKDYFVVVTNRQIYGRFNALQGFYPTKFCLKQFSIRSDFKEKYGVDIPEYITDSDLSADESYKLVDFTSGESFENAVLRKFTGQFFLSDRFPFRNLAALCKDFSPDVLEDENKIILRKVFQKRFSEFSKEASGNYEDFILTEFKENFADLKSNVAMYLTISNYPEQFREDVLGKDVNKCLDHFSVSGEAPVLDSDGESVYRNYADAYLHRSDVDFTVALKVVSGRYSFELEQVLDKKKTFGEGDIQDIQNKFETLFLENPEEKRRVKMLKPPVELRKPDGYTEIGQWLDWAVDNYLPYRFWLELTDRVDENADNYSAMYADWIFEHYDSLVNNFPDMMHRILPTLMGEFSTNPHSLVIILDNFNYKFEGELERYLNDRKFQLQDSKPVLAMLPTETIISKRAFFTGEAYNSNKSSYKEIVSSWETQTGMSMKYLPDIGKLMQMTSFDEKVVFLNYLRFDQMLHEDLSGSALHIEDRIQNELEALVKEIVSLLKKLGREKDTDIYFIADHGSTKISPEQQNHIATQYYKDKAEDSDYRFIAVKDSEYERIKTGTSGLCYALDKSRYSTPDNYLIAKKYNRFIRNDMKGYVHGGISPEESIVPFMHFAYDMLQCVDPEITLQNDQLRFSVKTKLIFLVKNFNEFELKDIQFQIQNSNIKYTSAEAVNIDGFGNILVNVPDARITKAMDKQYNETMFIKLSYVANGRKHELQVKIEMPVKSLQSKGSGLSDLF